MPNYLVVCNYTPPQPRRLRLEVQAENAVDAVSIAMANVRAKGWDCGLKWVDELPRITPDALEVLWDEMTVHVPAHWKPIDKSEECLKTIAK